MSQLFRVAQSTSRGLKRWCITHPRLVPVVAAITVAAALAVAVRRSKFASHVCHPTESQFAFIGPSLAALPTELLLAITRDLSVRDMCALDAVGGPFLCGTPRWPFNEVYFFRSLYRCITRCASQPYG
jgi:hypothetical protein